MNNSWRETIIELVKHFLTMLAVGVSIALVTCLTVK